MAMVKALFALLLAAILIGTTAYSLTVVDETGTPVAGALVTFSALDGQTASARTDGGGRVSAPAGFIPAEAQTRAPGFVSKRVRIGENLRTVTLERILAVVGSVRVATGSVRNLHSLPVAASMLDQTSIRASSAQTTDALLRELPGFDRTRSNSAFTNYGQLRVSFSGAGNDRGVVLVDGVPAQDGFGGQVDWAAYPPNTLVRAELLRGAGSALYGSGAVGGVLRIESFQPRVNKIEHYDGALSLGVGSPIVNQQWANVRFPIASKLAAAVSLERQAMAYDDLPPDSRGGVAQTAQSRSSIVLGRLRYAPSASSVLRLGIRGAWDAQQEGRPNYTFSRRYAQIDSAFSHCSAHALLTAMLFGRTGYVFNEADKFPSQPGTLLYTQNVRSNEVGSGFAWVVQSNNGEFAMHADARAVHGDSEQNDASARLQSAGSGSQQLAGIAAQETLHRGRLQMIVGLRYDTVGFSHGQLVSRPKTALTSTRLRQRIDAAVSPRLALSYTVWNNLVLRASTGAGFRAPFLNELLRGFNIGTVNFAPNASLIPEHSHASGAGVDWANQKQRLSLDAFRTTVGDAIMFRTIDPTHQIRSNVAHTQTDGATLTYMLRLSDQTRLSLAVTQQNARVTGGDAAIIGKRLQYVPQTSANLALQTHAGVLGIGIAASYLGQTYAEDLNTHPLGTAIVIGTHVSVPLGKRAALVLNGENVTNARYLSSIDRLGTPAAFSASLVLPVGMTDDDTGLSPAFR